VIKAANLVLWNKCFGVTIYQRSGEGKL